MTLLTVSDLCSVRRDFSYVDLKRSAQGPQLLQVCPVAALGRCGGGCSPPHQAASDLSAAGALGFAGGVQQPPFLVTPPQEGGAGISKALDGWGSDSGSDPRTVPISALHRPSGQSHLPTPFYASSCHLPTDSPFGWCHQEPCPSVWERLWVTVRLSFA